MAKFCNMCGKPLEEGEVCDCQNQVAEAAPAADASQGEYTAPSQAVTQPQNQGQFNQGQQQFNQGQFNGGAQFNAGQFNQGPSQANAFVNKVIGIVKNPVEEIRNIAYSGNNTDSFILLGVGAVLYIIGLALAMLKLHLKLGDAAKEMKLPYVKYVIMIAIMMVIVDIIAGVMMFVGTKVVDKTANPSMVPVWAVVGLKSVYKGIGVVAGGIVTLLLPWPGISVMVAGAFVSFVLAANAYCVIMQLDQVRSTYIQMISAAVTVLIAMFCTYMVMETAKDDIVNAAMSIAMSGLSSLR